MITIWHNTKCSKSREAKSILDNINDDVEVFEYLKDKLTTEKIKEVKGLLGLDDIKEMLRKKETEYKELNIENKTEDEILEILLKYPKLIERPIIIKNSKAVIARPMQNLTDLLSEAE